MIRKLIHNSGFVTVPAGLLLMFLYLSPLSFTLGVVTVVSGVTGLCASRWRGAR